ncbi:MULTISPECIES: hypothetical protein [unclassified Streptomyces]|uniref:hypothetical protein n=1 Tax=unclassified Streptomyces TaxID=2593676 RepID=UPI00333264C9
MPRNEDEHAYGSALLVGGPADGVRIEVRGSPDVIQVTVPCRVETPGSEVRAAAVYVYRRESGGSASPRYGFDPASP